MAARKKAVNPEFSNVSQANVSMLASEALRKNRSTNVRLAMRVTGLTPLLMHRWTQKAIMQMVGKMVGQPQARGHKDLTAEYLDSYFRNMKDEVCMPMRILKAAIVSGAIATAGVTSKAELKRDLRILGYTSPIRLRGKPVTPNHGMKMDARIASNSGTPDMRSRAVIEEGWTFDFVAQFPTSLTPDKVVAALDGAGGSIGLCDWRPEKGGDYGTFGVEVLKDGDIARILKECSLPEKEFVLPPEFLRSFANIADNSKAPDNVKKAAAVVRKIAEDNAHAAAAPKRGRPSKVAVLPELPLPPVISPKKRGRPRKDLNGAGAHAAN